MIRYRFLGGVALFLTCGALLANPDPISSYACFNNDRSFEIETTFGVIRTAPTMHIVENDEETFPTPHQVLGVGSRIVRDTSALGQVISGEITPVYPGAKPSRVYRLLVPRLGPPQGTEVQEVTFDSIVLIESKKADSEPTANPTFEKMIPVVCKGFIMAQHQLK